LLYIIFIYYIYDIFPQHLFSFGSVGPHVYHALLPMNSPASFPPFRFPFMFGSCHVYHRQSALSKKMEINECSRLNVTSLSAPNEGFFMLSLWLSPRLSPFSLFFASHIYIGIYNQLCHGEIRVNIRYSLQPPSSNPRTIEPSINATTTTTTTTATNIAITTNTQARFRHLHAPIPNHCTFTRVAITNCNHLRFWRSPPSISDFCIRTAFMWHYESPSKVPLCSPRW